ncbi:MAG TPA: lysophospholipid acyltransferase family protein [Casimicrobiaceae bacterium]|nr:lysophospholipid acyltransferase family protein [Casimicrobiaceae bacterium]
MHDPLPLPLRAWRAGRVTLHLLAGLATTTLVFPLVAPAKRQALVRRWSRTLLRLLRVEPRIHGRLDAHRGNVLIVANHVSWLDIFVLNAHRPARFVAKAELAGWPLAGRLIRDVGTIFVERGRRHDTRRVNHHAAQALLDGDVVAVFPEGTTTAGDEVLRFHASLLQPIVETNGHVQPVAIRYRDQAGRLSRAPAYVGDQSFAASFWCVCGERATVVELHVPPSIHAQHRDRRALAREAEAAIRTALGLPASATGPGRGGDPEGGPP